MFVVCDVCYQVEVSATSWPLVQRSPTDCGMSCVIENLRGRGHSRRRSTVPEKIIIALVWSIPLCVVIVVYQRIISQTQHLYNIKK
jgi:hypothetical protein